MRRALVAVTLFSLTACTTPSEPKSPPPSTAAVMEMPIACAVVDGAYTALGPDARATLARGRAAEAKGDTAGVKAALDALKPIHLSTAAALADAASKVRDPEMKAALQSLADSAAKAAAFDNFTEFQSLAAMTAAAEATVKKKCLEAGVVLKNLD